jgi:hypothetical protein
MIPFDPECPFPLLPIDGHSYKEAQDHSQQVDDWLGFKADAIEKELFQSTRYVGTDTDIQFWKGLSLQAMQTPYTEIRGILNLLTIKENDTIVDLGCSYGRMAHVIGRHYPGVAFIGYELVDERVQEGQRVLAKFNYPRVRLETCDLSAKSFTPPVAEYYFIFDFGSRAAIEKTLEDLREIAQKKSITLIARGRGIRHQIYQGHPWLCAIHEPQVFDHFTIFKS